MKYDGAKFFDLKDRHGLPLEVALDKIYGEGFKIDWEGFVKRGLHLKVSKEKLKRIMDETLLESFIPKEVKADILSDFNQII